MCGKEAVIAIFREKETRICRETRLDPCSAKSISPSRKKSESLCPGRAPELAHVQVHDPCHGDAANATDRTLIIQWEFIYGTGTLHATIVTFVGMLMPG